MSSPLKMPPIPVLPKYFIPYFAAKCKTSVPELLAPFKAYESELRRCYAQAPNEPFLKDGLTNMVPIFGQRKNKLKIRARKLQEESEEEKGRYIMPLAEGERKLEGAPVFVTSFEEFQKNFDIFSNSSLSMLDWENVVAAGSAVTTALVPVPEVWKQKEKEYYHDKFAPTSDVDLFLYGLSEEEGLKKIIQIESNIRDSIAHGDMTTIRTKNAVTIVSQYPTRHVQIVLRLYDSISQIITGFDVDSSCTAYDGKQVWASPRAIAAFATQTNTIDLTRRSPSYEHRLSKYSQRGFEVYWEALDRSRVNPRLFKFRFNRTHGLARLLVLENLRKKRVRAEQERRVTHQEDVETDEFSNYNTVGIPYGKPFTAFEIVELLKEKDRLLNPEHTPDKYHRHPCFFGTAEKVLQDCCGCCPKSETNEGRKIESKYYISGALKFIKDDPGRQDVGSFNPITKDDWTEMAYVMSLSSALKSGLRTWMNLVKKQRGGCW